MTATYNETTYIFGSSRLTYDGEADDTVGVGHVPAPRSPVSLPPPSASAAVRPLPATVVATPDPSPRPR